MEREDRPCRSGHPGDVDMSASTPTAGYPVHAVATFARRENEFRAWFTDWTAQCGATGTESGRAAFGLAGSARKLELCVKCFPGRHWNSCGIAKPIDETERMG